MEFVTSRVRTYWQNDLRRLRVIRRFFRSLRQAVSKRRLSPTRALMDLQVLHPKSELLNYDKATEGYRWVLVSKPQVRRWF